MTRKGGNFQHAGLGDGIPDIDIPDGVDPFSGFHVRRDHKSKFNESTNEKSGSNTSSQNSLPLSPLMDPNFFEAREKHHKPKAPPSKKPTPFQKQLAKNPYAQALATPVRQCVASKEVLPRFFLEDFSILTHPTTGNPWWVPRNLTSKKSMDEPAPVSAKDKTTETSQIHTQRGFHNLLLSRKMLVEALDLKNSGYQHAIPSLKGFEGSRHAVEQAYFRPDMDTFVLELMRRRTVESLLHLVGLKRGYVVGCVDWEDAKRKPQTAVVLWNAPEELEAQRPPEFATLEVGLKNPHQVPVHDLYKLLGSEHMDKLQEQCTHKIFDREVLVLKHKNMTIDTQLLLWKLQGYLAQYGYTPPSGPDP